MADSPAREGSLEAPFRHPIEWRSESYYDLSAIEAEMERVFDVCHTCRRSIRCGKSTFQGCGGT